MLDKKTLTQKKREHTNFVNMYVRSLIEGNAAIFIGSGFSRKSGLPTWSELLKDAATKINVEIHEDTDLVTLAQYIKNEGKAHAVKKIITEKIDSCNAKPTDQHNILAQLPIQSYWTTNYDNLIETSLSNTGRHLDIKYVPKHLANNDRKADAVVYKMHGDVGDLKSVILTRDDYEIYNREKELFSTKLKSDLLEKTFLFIGFSFDDPNIMYIMSNLRILLKGEKTKHYWIIKRIERKEKEKIKLFKNRKRLQELQIKDLKRYGIYAVVIDDFDEIDALIERIKEDYKRKNIFISGAAVDYSPYTRDKAGLLISNIVIQLLSAGNKIVCGYGLGVGDFIVNAALSYMEGVKKGEYEDKRSLDINNFLDIQPFPQNIENDEERRLRWTNCRKNLIKKSGVAIFLFGNKMIRDDDDERKFYPSLANGMDEEFELARSFNLKIIPIPSTKYKALEYYNILKCNSTQDHDFIILGDIPPDDITKIAYHVSRMTKN